MLTLLFLDIRPWRIARHKVNQPCRGKLNFHADIEHLFLQQCRDSREKTVTCECLLNAVKNKPAAGQRAPISDVITWRA
jgi:hypothetical protein